MKYYLLIIILICIKLGKSQSFTQSFFKSKYRTSCISNTEIRSITENDTIKFDLNNTSNINCTNLILLDSTYVLEHSDTIEFNQGTDGAIIREEVNNGKYIYKSELNLITFFPKQSKLKFTFSILKFENNVLLIKRLVTQK